MNTRLGWECPKCGRVWGPLYPACARCNQQISNQEHESSEQRWPETGEKVRMRGTPAEATVLRVEHEPAGTRVVFEDADTKFFCKGKDSRWFWEHWERVGEERQPAQDKRSRPSDPNKWPEPGDPIVRLSDNEGVTVTKVDPPYRLGSMGHIYYRKQDGKMDLWWASSPAEFWRDWQPLSATLK